MTYDTYEEKIKPKQTKLEMNFNPLFSDSPRRDPHYHHPLILLSTLQNN